MQIMFVVCCSQQNLVPWAPWCRRHSCGSSWRSSAIIRSSWAAMTVMKNPPPRLPRPRLLWPSSARLFGRLCPLRVWGDSWRCLWKRRCSQGLCRRGNFANRAWKVRTWHHHSCFNICFWPYAIMKPIVKCIFSLDWCSKSSLSLSYSYENRFIWDPSTGLSGFSTRQWAQGRQQVPQRFR